MEAAGENGRELIQLQQREQGMGKGTIAAALLTTMFCGSLDAYEVGTHERLSQLAYDRSVLADRANGPLATLRPGEHDATYLSSPPDGGTPEYGTARELLGWGARYEDQPFWEGRYLNHFYDPQQGGIGLGAFNGRPSPDWSLEDVSEDASQEFSLKDAVDFYKSALTWTSEDFREQGLTLLFQSIGRGIHHIQDMSQPAHVRNDLHPLTAENDRFEDYTETQFVRRHRPLPVIDLYGPAGLDLSQFPNARAFWSNNAKGVAEFTTNNFVSEDTNFRLSGDSLLTEVNHPSPAAPLEPQLENRTLRELGVANALFPGAVVSFIGTDVVDALSGTTTFNSRTSSVSVFSYDLTSVQTHPVMPINMNVFNFEASYPFLFSRAVAYSAGLINYFFRGRIALDSATFTAGQVEVTIRNLSSAQLALADSAQTTEEFSVYYDASDGTRKRLALNADDLSGDALAFNETRTLTFSMPLNLDTSKKAPFLLVYDGVIGMERGIAAVAFGSGAGAFLVTPNYTPADGITGPRVVRWNGSSWVLTQETGKLAGNVDWRGLSDVLTWGGGFARYFNPTGSAVYKNGARLTTGPAGVSGQIIGSSIRLVDGVRTLNLVKVSSSTLRIYSRLYADQYPNETLWSASNPLGWRLVYSGVHGSGFTGFFFNASGTEGQYITRHSDGGPDKRVKVRLNGYTAQVSTFPARATIRKTTGPNSVVSPQLDIRHGVCSTAYTPQGQMVGEASDPCKRVGYHLVRTTARRDRSIEVYSQQTLLCVDYIGDKEVFCELLPPDTEQPALVEEWTRIEVDRHRVDNSNMGSGTCGAERHETDSKNTTKTTDRLQRRLRVGTAEFTWSGRNTDGLSGTFWSGDLDVFSGDRPGEQTSRSESWFVSATKILHLDARYDLAIFETRDRNTKQTSAAAWTHRTTNLQIARTNEETVADRAVLKRSSKEKNIFERSSTTSSQSTATGTTGDLNGYPDLCAEGYRDNEYATTQTVADVGVGTSFLSEEASTGGVAVDALGRMAASKSINVAGFTPSENGGIWNSLDGGDLSALIPSASPVAAKSYTIKVLQ
jgi:hypothetical protein